MCPAVLRLAQRARKFGIPCRRRFLIIKILQDATLDFRAEHTLNALDQGFVLTGDEGEGVAGLCGAAGTADAVCVSIRRIRNVIVDDVGYAQDIDAAGGDIGGHQNLVGAVAEAVKGILALVLGEVPLERGSLVPCLLKLLSDAFGPVLGACKDQNRFAYRCASRVP